MSGVIDIGEQFPVLCMQISGPDPAHQLSARFPVGGNAKSKIELGRFQRDQAMFSIMCPDISIGVSKIPKTSQIGRYRGRQDQERHQLLEQAMETSKLLIRIRN